MSSSMDVAGLITMLESADLQASQAVKELVLDNLRKNKDIWLVNALVDSYILTRAPRCLEIIYAVSEPHDKHVFDRLCDHIKGQHKIVAMGILATLVYKQPTWLHKIVSHPLLNVLLKCLKMDSDVPVLLSGLLIVTALLPVVPVIIKEHLPHLFDVFSRLATFCLKPPAHVPELYRYHLNVGVYCLHHRLYGMYPYHFLTYLRNIYSKREQQQVFEHVIKPMIDKVRLHPMLFTTTREKEISRDRWRQKEVHDILVDCAQFSLDLTEGCTSEMSVPGPQKLAEQSHNTPKLFQNLTDMMTPSPGSLLANVDVSMVMTSGLHGSGVMTPPPGQSSEPHTPGIQGTQGHTSSHPGTALDSPVPEEKTSKAKKRLSQTGLTLAGKMPTSTETTPLYPDHCSIPPSPLRPDFSNEPPLSAPHMQAIRKLSFQQPEGAFHADVGRALEKILCNSDKFPRQPTGLNTTEEFSLTADVLPPAGIQENEQVTTADLMKTERTKAVKSTEHIAIIETETVDVSITPQPMEGNGMAILDNKPSSEDVSTKSAPANLESVDTQRAPSLTNLPKFLDNLDDQPEDTDNEVTELTADSTPDADGCDLYSEDSDAPSHLPTATYMAVLMKKVNRIRFNSINIHTDSQVEKTLKTARPRSCPNLHAEDTGEKSTSQKNKDADSIASFSIDSPSVSLSTDEKRAEKLMRSSSSQTSLYALSTALLKKRKDRAISTDTTGTETVDIDEDFPLDDFPYQELFCMTLPFSPFIQCYTCTQQQRIQPAMKRSPKQRTQPVLDDVKPLFSACSPVELLDCMLATSADCHHRTGAGLSPGSHTHIPDLSTCEDVTILRGQIEMLHHQLLYERHKREQHAQRNRRLLSRTVKTTALQEHNIAMHDQLQLQEHELASLRQALQKQQKQTQQLQHANITHEADVEKTQRTYRSKLEALEAQKKGLEAQLQAAKNDKDKALEELQTHKSQVFDLSQEVEAARLQCSLTTELQDQVVRLNKELLLMGELQEKYQSRLVAHTRSETNNIHTQFLLQTYKTELQNVKSNSSKKAMQLEGSEVKISAMEEKCKQKDAAILDLKQMMETARDTYREELESVEDKYESLKKIHLALQTEFLNVYEQIGRREAAALRVNRQRPPAADRRVSPEDGAGIGAEGSSDWNVLMTSGCSDPDHAARSQDMPEAWRAPASESSVESAEEAFSMDTSSQ